MPSDILLVSFKQSPCANIFKGRKSLVIFKKRVLVFKRQDRFYPARFSHMMIYNSQSHAIVGMVKVGEVISRTTYQWSDVELKNLCMSREEVAEYLRSPFRVGFGIEIFKPRLFPNPIHRETMISDLGVKPPSHPRYLPEEESRKIVERAIPIW